MSHLNSRLLYLIMMKKILKFIIGGICIALLSFVFFFIALTFDEEDQCLDKGGVYNHSTHTCKK